MGWQETQGEGGVTLVAAVAVSAVHTVLIVSHNCVSLISEMDAVCTKFKTSASLRCARFEL